FQAAQSSDAASYDVTVSSPFGTRVTDPVLLTVNLATVDSLDAEGDGPGFTALAVQSDGKILAGGGSWYGTAELRRLDPDGTPDRAFQPQFSGGISDDFQYSSVNALGVQPDGKILVGGNFDSVNDSPRQNLVRLTPDGSVDQSFVPGEL